MFISIYKCFRSLHKCLKSVNKCLKVESVCRCICCTHRYLLLFCFCSFFFFFCSGGKGGGVWRASRAYCPTGLKLKRKYQLGTVNSLHICPRRKSKIRFFGLPHSSPTERMIQSWAFSILS